MQGPMLFDGKRMISSSMAASRPLLDERGGGASDYAE